MILNEIPADQSASDGKEGFVKEMRLFGSQFQSPELMQPRNRTFSRLARFTQTAAVGGASLGQQRADALGPQGPSMGIRIVSAVILHNTRMPTGTPTSAPQCRYRINQGQRWRHIMGIGDVSIAASGMPRASVMR